MHFQCQTCASYNAEQRADRESGKMLDLAHTHTHTPLSITISDRSFHTHKTVMIASLLLRCTLFSWHFWFCEALSASGFLLLTEASYTHVQNCSSACNTHYDLRCVASYQPSPSYFYPTGKTRASMPTGHWCEITQNTVPRLDSSPRQNSHMHCQPRGRAPPGIQRNFSNHTWSKDIIAVWNKGVTRMAYSPRLWLMAIGW